MNTLKLGMLNCQGIMSKFETPDFQKMVISEDIFGVCETWLSSGKEPINIPGFNFYPLNRKKEKGMTRGGLGLFIRHEIKEFVKVRYDISTENVLWCKVKKDFLNTGDDLFIGMVYFPPEYSSREKRLNIDHFNNLLEVTSALPNNKVILMGDFNARTGKKEDTLQPEKHDTNLETTNFFSQIKNKRNNQDKKENKYGNLLLEFCTATHSYIANGRTLGDFQGKYTCHETRGSSTVDYAVVNECLQKSIKKFHVLTPSVGSDHCPIKLEMSYPKGKLQKAKTKTSKVKPNIKWNEQIKEMFQFRTSLPDTLEQLDELEKMIDDPTNNIDTVTEKLGKIYSKALKNKTGNKSSHKNIKPKKWYDKSCSEMSKNLKLTAYLLSKSPNDPFLRGRLIKNRKEYKKLLKLKKREHHNGLIKKLESLESKNPKEYWNLLKQLRNNKLEQKICNTETFVTFFEDLFSKEEDLPTQQKEVEEAVLRALENVRSMGDFTLEEFMKALKLLKINKSAGPDRIPGEAIKASPLKMLEIILKIMNKIKNNMYYPDNWTEGITSLLLKEGDDEDPNNYRAITVINIIAKLFAIMINERLHAFLDKEKIIKKEQIGFVKKCRPADHLFVLKSLIDHYNNKGEKLYTCFVDFQKAFDSVWRMGLFHKLLKSGIEPGIVKLIKDMYDKSSQRLKIGNRISRKFMTHRGVKQGCILSPKLFNLFINDIPDIFDRTCDPVHLGNEELSCLMYADDLILMSETKEGLQNCLNNLEEYTLKWNLKINLKKTQVIIFQNGGYKGQLPTFYFGTTQLKIVKEYKYLGTIISNTGNFNLNETNLKKKGLRASYLLTKSLNGAKPSSAIKIFEKIIEPILLYNCEIALAYLPKTWDCSKFGIDIWDHGKEINKVTMSFLRQLLGVHKKTSNIGIMSETGKHPIMMKAYTQIFKYWLRLKNTENKLLKEALKINIEDHTKGKKSWLKIIEFLKKVTGADYTGNILKDTQNFKLRIKAFFDVSWEAEAFLKDRSKLDFYFSLKKTFGYEKYLDNLDLSARVHVTKLRLSGHCLPVEILRYNKKYPNREDRTCNICELNVLGDEKHYLNSCKNKRMTDVRSIFLESIKQTCPQLALFKNEDIITYCLCMKDELIQEPTAIFIKQLYATYKEEVKLPPLKIICLKRMRKLRR